MGTLKDITDLLEKIPIWKKIKPLPDKVAELEQRIEALEEKLSAPRSENACPSCGEHAFFVESSKPHPSHHLAEVGTLQQNLACRSCGYKESKVKLPGKP